MPSYKLLEKVLCCKECKGDLEINEKRAKCKKCGKEYFFTENGILDMMD